MDTTSTHSKSDSTQRGRWIKVALLLIAIASIMALLLSFSIVFLSPGGRQ